MQPLFFGDSRAPLFGVYHPPRSRGDGRSGVVLCYPLGQEYMRAHRAFRQLAMLLTRAGHHVLRFDYSGTGDSAGEPDDAGLDRWAADIATARAELKDMSGCREVSLVGLRLGAALAARSAMAGSEVRRVVLWDPVVDGAAYLRSLLEIGGVSPDSDGELRGTVGVSGFPLGERLRAELPVLEPDSIGRADRTDVHLVISEEREDYALLRERLHAGGRLAGYRHIPAPSNWNEVDRFGSVLLPQDIIHGIVEALAPELR